MANSIDNFTHGLAVAASFLVGIKVWYSFFYTYYITVFCAKIYEKNILGFLKNIPRIYSEFVKTQSFNCKNC